MTEIKKTELTISPSPERYEITVGCGLLREAGAWLRGLAPSAARCQIVSNEKVHSLYGSEVLGSLNRAGVESSFFLMPDGEEHKTLDNAAKAVAAMTDAGIRRTDAVIALGGGVVGDLAGFAASIHLRGVAFFQIPTTLLSMIDSSVGGKTGVNTAAGKNLVGTFHNASGVLADVGTLQTLEARELAAGFYEAVKQAALSGRPLLEDLFEFLRAYPPSTLADRAFDPELTQRLTDIVSEQIRFKASVVSGDSREAVSRKDGLSRKILNFGHTTGHALEKATEFRYFRHGEAVGYGILVAAEIGKRLEICPRDSIDLLNDVVRSVGVLPDAGNIPVNRVLSSIEFDKKSSGDSIQWILLEDLGKPVIVSGPDIPPNVIKEAIESVLSRRSTN